MAIQDYTLPYEIELNRDEQGNSITIAINSEPHVIYDSQVLLAQIPDEFFKVSITGKYEKYITQSINNTNEYKVDYTNGVVYFHSDLEGTNITINTYSGRGIKLLYASRVKLEDLDNLFTSINVEGGMKELAERLNNLLQNTQQASEVVDARIDSNTGTNYSILKNRLDTEYSETYNARTNSIPAIPVVYSSLKIRLDTEYQEVSNKIGDLSTSTTTEKGSVVGITNEIKANFDAHKTDYASLIINVKYPPIGLTAAKVDGITDDTTAVQAIIDYISANSNGVCYFPKGTCICSHLTPKSNVVLQGVGKGISIIKMKDATNADFIVPLAGSTNYGIEKITIDGNKTNNTNGANLLIFGTNVNINNVESINTKAYGICGVIGDNISIKNCNIHDCFGVGILMGVADCTINNFIIDGCSIYNNDSHGIKIGNGSTAIAKRGIITNNFLHDNGANDGGGGVWASLGSSEITISNNIVYSNDGDNIGVDGGVYISIIGNKSSDANGPTHDTANSGIAISAGSVNIIAIGNQCWENTACGIIVRGTCSHVTIANNVCWNNSQYMANNYCGIQVDTILPDTDSGDYVIIESNRCFDDQTTRTQSYGIKIDANADCLICRNNIVTNNLTGTILNEAANAKDVLIVDNIGYNPVGTLTAPTLSSATPITNEFAFPVRVIVTGGAVTDILINSIWIGVAAGVFILNPGDTISIAYTVAPTWTWMGM